MRFLNTEECVDEEHQQAVDAFCDKFWARLVSISYANSYVMESGKLEPVCRFSDDEYTDVIKKSLIE